MQVKLNNFNTNFNGTLKIYCVGNNHPNISAQSVKFIEKAFSYATKDENGHMDVILHDRYSSQFAIPDKILYKNGNYADYVETYIKNCSDTNTLISKLVSIFYEFNDIKMSKDKILTMLK